MAGVVFADEMGEDGNALDQAMQCMRALEAQERELRRSSLRDRIRTAERNGKFDEAMVLMEEFNRFELKRST